MDEKIKSAFDRALSRGERLEFLEKYGEWCRADEGRLVMNACGRFIPAQALKNKADRLLKELVGE